jgi:hypothetical protein
MDHLGQALIALAALILGTVAALLSLAIPSLRRFTLAILITPPAAVSLYYICGALIPNNRMVCGPDAIWGNCASTGAEITGWVIWLACSLCAMAVGYWGQRLLHGALRAWFASSPMSLYRNRPRWSRVVYDSTNSE